MSQIKQVRFKLDPKTVTDLVFESAYCFGKHELQSSQTDENHSVIRLKVVLDAY